jgi:chromosome segregation ATPase
MSDGILDSPGACISELSDINRELAEFGHEWSNLAGELKRYEREYDRLYRTAMRGIDGRNAEERQAAAHAAVEKVAEGLAEKIATLDGKVEDYKTRFKSLERRASIIQSVLAAMREESKIANFVHG